MARELLTDKRVAAMKPPASGRKEVFDTVKTGLCFRLTAKGARSWSVMYRFGGELRRETIGSYPQVTVAKARQLATSILEFAGAGQDPRAMAAAAEAAAATRRADTVEAVAEQFIAKHVAQRRWREMERVLRRDVIPHWKGRPITEVSRRDVIELIDAIVERAPVQANRTLTVLSILFGWALDRDIIEIDPTSRVRKPTREAARDRVLSDAELISFWRGCDKLGWPFGPLFKLLALTAQRKSEIADLRWSEINLNDRLIELSGARYKTGKPHTVPLSEAAVSIIAELPRVGEIPDHLFTTNGKTTVSGFSRAKSNLDTYMASELGEKANWIIHDLRRTARTNFSKLGIAPDIGERVLGHVIGGVRGVYDRHTFLPQMRECLDKWSWHLEALMAPSANVIKLPVRKA